MGVTEISYSQVMDSMTPALREKPTGDVEKGVLFSTMLEGKRQKCPYDYLAKDGVIEYNGVTFVCDYKKNSICLGDMTNPKEVLNISLPSGGSLKVNINNLDDLTKATGMFSPADLNAIMRAIAQYNHCTSKLNEIEEEENESVESAAEQSALVLKEEKDWREMTDEEWDEMLEGVDDYIDAFKERLRQLKEMQEEAAQKAALEADADMRATAASSAALSAAANGLGDTSEADAESRTEEGIPAEDGVKHEKNWTKNLKTDDRTVLRIAKEAQEMEKKALSKFEEVQLTGTTTVGISQTDTVTECASVEEDDNKEKVWTITAFTENGIVSNKCQNGKIIDSWELKYTNPDDAKKVQDFLNRLDKEVDLNFSGSKDFWEEFLNKESIVDF